MSSSSPVLRRPIGRSSGWRESSSSRSRSRFAFTYLAALRASDLEERVATLPEHSAVYYVLVTEDGAGDKFHPLEFVERVTAAANRPTYSWVDSGVDHGILGGDLYVQKAAIESVGRLALRVLHGERADSIPTSAIDLNVVQSGLAPVATVGH